VAAAKEAKDVLVFVTVAPGLQVVHHGFIFGPGETAQVPEEVAGKWIAAGWVVAQ
jgi:hypothetical protein